MGLVQLGICQHTVWWALFLRRKDVRLWQEQWGRTPWRDGEDIVWARGAGRSGVSCSVTQVSNRVTSTSESLAARVDQTSKTQSSFGAALPV